MSQKQKYYKKENKKINKTDLIEITGARTELQPYLKSELNCSCFVTNTIGYQGEKRLVTEVKIPGTKFFIKHVWFKYENIGKLKHGYQKLRVKVTEYKDHITQETKYGLQYIGDKGKVFKNNNLIIPKWKLEELENQKDLKDFND